MSSAISFIGLFLLISLVSITMPCVAKKEAVRNSGGDVMSFSYMYQIQSVDKRFGGINKLPVDNTSCSTLLVHLSDSGVYEDITGFWLDKFDPNSDGVIRLSTDLNIHFPDGGPWTPPQCSKTRQWQISYDKQEKQYFVVSDIEEKRNGMFRIEKLGSSYYFQFCQSKKKTCRNVGIYVKNGLRRLALTNVALKVKFAGNIVF